MPDYRAIFEAVESTLIREGSRHLPEALVRSRLDEYKQVEGKRFTDAEYHWILVYVVWYSGFKAATVNAKLDRIRQHFPNPETVARYGEKEIQRILHDPGMIHNERKIRACVENARTFAQIVDKHGTFENYISSFAPFYQFENLMLLREELRYLFSGLGEITTYHVLTEIGLPVLKPDRVICRVFQRLGLIEDERQQLKTIIQGRRFAQATGHPIRYIDIVFVLYGQAQSKEFGLTTGICLPRYPKCAVCGVRRYCTYDARPHTAQPAMPGEDVFIALPHGGPGAGFHVSQLVEYIRSSGREYIIQAQQQYKLQDHTKPQSLDFWLRNNCTDRKDTAQAVNPVMDALEATGQFKIVEKLVCPDSGRKCKGLRLIQG